MSAIPTIQQTFEIQPFRHYEYTAEYYQAKMPVLSGSAFSSLKTIPFYLRNVRPPKIFSASPQVDVRYLVYPIL